RARADGRALLGSRRGWSPSAILRASRQSAIATCWKGTSLMTEPCDLSAVEARRLIGNKKLSPVELLEGCLKRIEKVNPTLNAIVAMDEKAAKDAAKAAEQAVMRGDDLGLLHGLPIGVKDLQATGGLRTTWGSLIYKDHVPEKDEATVANLR